MTRRLIQIGAWAGARRSCGKRSQALVFVERSAATTSLCRSSPATPDRRANHTVFGSKAIKAALATAVDTQATQDLIDGDERFKDLWDVVSLVPGSFGELNAAAMFTVLRDQQAAVVVEIGSYLGRSTVFFAKTLQAVGVEAPRVIAIDPHTGDRQQMEALGTSTMPSFDLFRTHVLACGVSDSVHPIVQRSSDAAVGWREPIDFLYVDGWHSYDAVMQDGRDWLPHLTPEGVVFFDDYARYREVNRAVKDLAAEGQFVLWGNSFGQAVGGRSAPPAAADGLLTLARAPLSRRLHRLRER
jgi:predicted O-methyltransferase YrrM